MLKTWAAPMLAAAVVLVSALPGLLALPPLDRAEARFAQSTAQMLESGDFVNVRLQGRVRPRPVGLNWLQALSVELVSSVERREIWAYRLPSLLCAMTAAAACAWGAAAFFGRRRGLLAGVILVSSLLFTGEAMLAQAGAALCAGVTLSMAALGRMYLQRDLKASDRRLQAVFWIGVAFGVAVAGPAAGAVTALAMLALLAADGDRRWLGRLGWRWGLLFLAAVLGPWSMAITVFTDGGSGTGLVGGIQAGGGHAHGLPLGFHAALTPVLFFPSAFLLPAALACGWIRRTDLGVRFALAWLLPSWLVLELAPAKLVSYPLPLYGALAWLAAAAVDHPFGPRLRWAGAILALLGGAGLALAVATITVALGGWDDALWAGLTVGLILAAAAYGAVVSLRGVKTASILAVAGLGVAAQLALSAGLAPRLTRLWVSQRAADLIGRAGLDPRDGLTPGPVVLVGYDEPSLIFALGTQTDATDATEAAAALAHGQPALVEQASDTAFRAALLKAKVSAQAVGVVEGYDYSQQRTVSLKLWRLMPPRPANQPGADLNATGSAGSAAAGSTPGG
jgi:4-amino-4-deoxy-L-arabinose transferase-like glycosyltransferase